MSDDPTDAEYTNLVHQTVDKIAPLLSGKSSQIQGAILADLLAIWLAGHIVISPDETEPDQRSSNEAREQLLTIHIEAVRGLIPVNEAIILKRHRNAARALS